MLPVENIDVALCPTITVIPMRMHLGDGSFTLKNVQAMISSVAEYEHVPLGKIQSWIRPGAPLFELLFSVSVQQQEDSEIWESCSYEPPAADVSLALSVMSPFLIVISIHFLWKSLPMWTRIRSWFAQLGWKVSSLIRKLKPYFKASNALRPLWHGEKSFSSLRAHQRHSWMLDDYQGMKTLSLTR
jgi:hypothetical protein